MNQYASFVFAKCPPGCFCDRDRAVQLISIYTQLLQQTLWWAAEECRYPSTFEPATQALSPFQPQSCVRDRTAFSLLKKSYTLTVWLLKIFWTIPVAIIAILVSLPASICLIGRYVVVLHTIRLSVRSFDIVCTHLVNQKHRSAHATASELIN